MKEFPYNRDAVIEYARKWALSRNPSYYDFEKIGGDCTNFISQCLFAGGNAMNYTVDTGWNYRSLSDRAPAWSSVEFLFRFLISNKGIGPTASIAAEREVLPGDLIQLGTRDGHFYHTLIITHISPQILICAHSYDALDLPLERYQYGNVRYLHVEKVNR